MNEEPIVSVFLGFKDAIPSINSYYQPRGSRIYLNPVVKNFKQLIEQQLKNKIKDPLILQNALKADTNRRLKVKILYLLNDKRLIRDEDNLRKATQDAIFKFLKVDDWWITDSVSSRGVIKTPDTNEYILFQIYLHNEVRFFDITNIE